MSTINPGGLFATTMMGGQAIVDGAAAMQAAAERTIEATGGVRMPEDRVTIAGGSLEDAMMDTMKGKYGIAAGAAVVKAADEALQTVFEVFGP